MSITPSIRPGMGAIPYPGGATFRLWAPNAEQVHLVGSFNGWAPRDTPLASEPGGLWSVDVPGVRPGDLYRYTITHHRSVLERVDPYARDLRQAQGGVYALVPDPGFDWGPDSFSLPPRSQLVIYELHPGTFNCLPGDGGGFAGVIERLPYLAGLGINAIELMPVTSSDENNWGYSVFSMFATRTRYGTSAGFRSLVRAAHQHGIAVLLDVVYNHFTSRRARNLLWQFDGWAPASDKGGIYFYNDERAETGWGPRPNFGEKMVRRLIYDNLRWWLDDCRVDGLRWDATAYIHRFQAGRAFFPLADGWSLLQHANQQIRTHLPGKLSIAEDLQGNPDIVRPQPEGGAGFHAQWDAGIVNNARQVLTARLDEERALGPLLDSLTYRYNADPFERIIFSESHDEVASLNKKRRILAEPHLAGSRIAAAFALIAAALVLTTPGIPMIFQGQEFMDDSDFDSNFPLDWLKASAHRPFLEAFRRLITLRRSLDGKSRGLAGEHINLFHANHGDKVIAYHRWLLGGPGDDVVVVVNLSARCFPSYLCGFPRPGRWQALFHSPSALSGPGPAALPVLETGPAPLHGLPCTADLCLEPYSVMIFGNMQD